MKTEDEISICHDTSKEPGSIIPRAALQLSGLEDMSSWPYIQSTAASCPPLKRELQRSGWTIRLLYDLNIGMVVRGSGQPVSQRYTIRAKRASEVFEL